jgi:hypothetical protein
MMGFESGVTALRKLRTSHLSISMLVNLVNYVFKYFPSVSLSIGLFMSLSIPISYCPESELLTKLTEGVNISWLTEKVFGLRIHSLKGRRGTRYPSKSVRYFVLCEAQKTRKSERIMLSKDSY